VNVPRLGAGPPIVARLPIERGEADRVEPCEQRLDLRVRQTGDAQVRGRRVRATIVDAVLRVRAGRGRCAADRLRDAGGGDPDAAKAIGRLRMKSPFQDRGHVRARVGRGAARRSRRLAVIVAARGRDDASGGAHLHDRRGHTRTRAVVERIRARVGDLVSTAVIATRRGRVAGRRARFAIVGGTGGRDHAPRRADTHGLRVGVGSAAAIERVLDPVLDVITRAVRARLRGRITAGRRGRRRRLGVGGRCNRRRIALEQRAETVIERRIEIVPWLRVLRLLRIRGRFLPRAIDAGRSVGADQEGECEDPERAHARPCQHPACQRRGPRNKLDSSSSRRSGGS